MWIQLAAALTAMALPIVSSSPLSVSESCTIGCSVSDPVKAAIDAMTPDANGIINFTSTPIALDLPGFSIVKTITSLSPVKSAKWKTGSTGLDTVTGCSNHPALREGIPYCYYAMSYKLGDEDPDEDQKENFLAATPRPDEDQKNKDKAALPRPNEDQKKKDKAAFATADRGAGGKAHERKRKKTSATPLVVWEIDLPEAVCVVFNPAARLISMSIEPHFGATFGVFSLGITGATFASHGCGEFPLMDYVEIGNQVVSEEKLPTQLAVSGVFIIGISKFLEVSVTGSLAMNLDLGGNGEMSAPSAILYNLLQLDSEPVAVQWAVVIQATLTISITLGDLSLAEITPLEAQMFVKQTVGLPKVYVTMTMTHITKLSQIFRGFMKTFSGVCDVASTIVSDAIKESPLCHDEEDQGDAPQVKVFAVLQGRHGALGIHAWGKSMLVESYSDGWKLCIGDSCSEKFCLMDDHCTEKGFHCCLTTFTFRCEKYYRDFLSGRTLTCSELKIWPKRLRVDPVTAKSEGESCALDSECGLDENGNNLHCCHSTGDLHCRKVKVHKLTGGECSCLLALTGVCEDQVSRTCLGKAVNAFIALGLLLLHVSV